MLRSERTAVVVVGMHRSGTSALSGSLARLGAAPPRNVIPPSTSNPRGYWENQRIVDLHDELLLELGASWHSPGTFWEHARYAEVAQKYLRRMRTIVTEEFVDESLFVLKDPRISLLVPFWEELLRSLRCEPVWLFFFRNPLEVAASLQVRNGLALDAAIGLWLQYVLKAEHDTRSMKRAFAQFGELITRPKKMFRRVYADLEIEPPRRFGRLMHEVEDLLAAELRHHDVTDAELYDRSDVPTMAKRAYRAVSVLISDPKHAQARSELDAVRLQISRNNVGRPKLV